MAELETFRTEVRSWLEDNGPEELRGKVILEGYWGGKRPDEPLPGCAKWCALMADKGWTAPTWPREYGGGDLGPQETKIINQELMRARLPLPLTGFGLQMIGPTLLRYGTDEQKKEHLPRIINGTVRWVQGYSEPGSGSDLASVATSAVLDGDEYTINGQKIWTSFGEKGDWMFMLVRTNTEVKKQAGITFLLIDMDQPGIEVKPIKLISGASPFTETFFADAKALRSNVITEPNNGWTVAKALLGHERSMIGNTFGGGAPQKRDKERRAPNPIADLGKHHLGEQGGKVADPGMRDRITQLGMDHRCFLLTVQRNTDQVKAGHAPGPETSLFKIYGTELNQRREELMLSIRGPQALGWQGEGFATDELAQTRAWLRSRGNTIEGGTSEVQLNIIAKRVLSLPD